MPDELFSVSDKVVVITGGLGQLGRQFGVALADRGARVAVFDHDVEARRVAERFGTRQADQRFLFLHADVTRHDSIAAGLRRVNEAWGQVHALINCAALDASPHASAQENGPFERYPQRAWERVMEVNVTGAFLCCQVIGAHMAEAGGGSIINISSIYGMVSPDQRLYEFRRQHGEAFFKPVAYAASKSALMNLTRYLATYWAGKRVRVNTLSVGGVLNGQAEAFVLAYSARVPLGRMAREEEYNGAILFLVSDASSYMTGSNLVIDGGWTAW